MERCLTIVGLDVKDLTTSTACYEHQFGWKKLPSNNENISFFKLNGILLSLYSREKLAKDAQVSHKGEGFRGVTLAYNTRNKAEVDELFSTLTEKRVTIVKAPEEVFWGGYSGYAADPDGH
jgi:predicted lactoylglutathione lyase